MTPKITYISQDNTHRLIPARYSDTSVLDRLADDTQQLQDIFELDGATNDRLLGEGSLLPGISVHELLFGVTYAHIVNAAFTHPHPKGSRFNGADRGAWYAAFEFETAAAEVAFHKSQELQEIHWDEWQTFPFDDYWADFRTELHDIRNDVRFKACLNPTRYGRSQALAASLLASGSAGMVYPSVRAKGGTCVACFRPALVGNVRKGRSVIVKFANSQSTPRIEYL